MVVFYCLDEASEKLLREVVRPLTLASGSEVKLVLLDELVKREKMSVLIPPPKKEGSLLFKLLERQNAGLDISGWLVYGRQDVGTSTLLILGVDEKSAAVLRARGGKAYFGFGEVHFRNSKNPMGLGEKKDAPKV